MVVLLSLLRLVAIHQILHLTPFSPGGRWCIKLKYSRSCWSCSGGSFTIHCKGKRWGAGGAGVSPSSRQGGGGGYAEGDVTFTAGTFYIVIGKGDGSSTNHPNSTPSLVEVVLIGR